MDCIEQFYQRSIGIGIVSGIRDMLIFRPSLREMYFESREKARNSPYPHRFFAKEDECLFCGKERDYLFDFMVLTPVYLGESLGIRYICNSHKGEWWNCETGEKVINAGKPELLSLFHQIILGLVIPIRTIWFFLYDSFMWYVAVYPYYFFYRQLKK